MDIVTHSLIGMIGASPLLGSHPLAAVGFAFGSVLPDLDAVSRCAGKQAFVAWHQTWTHSLPVIAALGLAVWGAGVLAGQSDAELALGLAAGMTLHTLLDYTNTLGVALLLPFRRRRYCLEWVFFLDAFVIAACGVTFAALLPALVQGETTGWPLPLACGGALAVYWLLKGGLRAVAGRLAPVDTATLLPSALVPWRYLGCRQSAEQATLFHLDVFTGRTTTYAEYPILDDQYESVLGQVAAFALMRGLSPAYHLVEAAPHGAGQLLRCRDLRTRNFGTRYGDLEIELDSAGAIARVEFHV